MDAPASSSSLRGLLRAAGTVAGLTLLSRVFGFIRDLMMATALGAGFVSDCFLVAFKLPNFFRRLFAEGAFNNGFVPLYNEAVAKAGRAAALVFAAQVQSVLFWILAVVTALAEIGMPLVVMLFAPGFAGEPDKLDYTVAMSRITFPYLSCMSLVSLHGALLNAVGRFGVAAAAPILLNLCMIAALAWYDFAGGAAGDPQAGVALAWGVAAAGLTQLIWLGQAARREGLSLWPGRPRLTAEVTRLLKLMGPLVLAVGVSQLGVLIDLMLATMLAEGSVSYLYYADRLAQMPLGVVGTALGVTLLPLLSRQLAAGDAAQASDAQNRAIEVALLLALPATVALMVGSRPFIVGLFQHGAFKAEDAAATIPALVAFSAGLPAYILVKVLAPGFYARQDTVTPVRIAMLSLAVNIGLNLALMIPFKHVGLAAATATAAWLNAGLLWWTLGRRGHWAADPEQRRRMPRILAATAAMAGAMLLLIPPLDPYWTGATIERAAALAILVGGGGLTYLVFVILLRAITLAELKALMRRRAAGAPSVAAPPES